MSPAVELIRVSKSFGGSPVVDGLSLTVHDGEFFSILGSSGCGKSTTLRLIAGFERADAGEIKVGGEAAGSGEPAYAKRVNMVFQNYALFPHLTVAENIAFGLRMAGMSGANRERKTREMLAVVQLDGLETRMPSQLSGGQQQRVALARAMATEPQVVLLDEPLGALDLQLRRQMQQELKRIQRERGLTFVYVTHDQDEALSMSDRLCVMSAGRAMQTGTPQEIYRRPASRFVAEFIGDNNLLPCTVAAADDSHITVDVAGQTVRAPRMDFKTSPGMRALLAIRPEEVHCGTAPERGHVTLPGGIVEDAVYLGADSMVTIRLPGGATLRARRTGREGGIEQGRTVSVSWPETCACVLEREDDK